MAAAMAPPTIRLVQVSKSFGGRSVLDGIDLEIPGGQSLVIMGPSGTGKSVLLKHLIGLLRPEAGRVLLDGTDLWALSRREQALARRRFGFAFQEGALFDSMSVFDNIAFALRRHTALPPGEIRDRVTNCLQLVRLHGVEQRRPSELSTGMRRRVGFARAIVLEPEVLLFDEPTAGLDPVMVTVVNRVIVDLARRLRATTVMVTHDLRSARAVGERIAFLFRGRITADAPADRFAALDQPEVRQFVDGRAEGPLSVDEPAGPDPGQRAP